MLYKIRLNPFGIFSPLSRLHVSPFLIIGLLLLAGCGGGGGGDPTDNRVEISGSILLPGGTATPDNSMGLQGIANRSVSLFQIDDTGKVIGDVLDTGTSDSKGNYVLLLPENIAFSSDLIVEAKIDNNETARAIVIDASTDITPITEYITSKLIADPALDMSAMPLTEVAQLIEFVESLELEPQPDMAGMLVEIASFADLVVEAEIDDFNTAEPQVRLSGLLSVPASTSPKGLNVLQKPVPNHAVELYRIDNDGNPTGPAIAETTTNAEGVFTMLLPADVSLSSDLMLQAVVGGDTVHALVTNELLNIDAVSEYVYDQITTDPDLVVEALPVAEVYGIVVYVESLDIPETSNLTTTLSDIDAVAGTEVNNQIATIQTLSTASRGVFGTSLWGASSFE